MLSWELLLYITVFWKVSSCKLAAVFRRFGDPISSMFRKALALLSSRSYEPLVKLCHTTRRSIPENSDRLINHFQKYKHAERWIVYRCLFPAINISLRGGMDAQCKVFSFISFEILITPYLLQLTLLLSHGFCYATCRCEKNRKLVFYILQSLQYILITDPLKTERYLNYVQKT